MKRSLRLTTRNLQVHPILIIHISTTTSPMIPLTVPSSLKPCSQKCMPLSLSDCALGHAELGATGSFLRGSGGLGAGWEAVFGKGFGIALLDGDDGWMRLSKGSMSVRRLVLS